MHQGALLGKVRYINDACVISCLGHGLDDSRKFGWQTPEKGEYSSPL